MENFCKCGCEHKFEETEKGFKLEVTVPEEKKPFLKDLIALVKKHHCCE